MPRHSRRHSVKRSASRRGASPSTHLSALFPKVKSASPSRGSRSRSKSPSAHVVRGSPEAPIQRDLKAMVNDRVLWFYFLLGIIVFVAIFVIGRVHHARVHTWARFPVWMSNPYLLSVVTFVVIALAAYSTYGGHVRSTPVGRNTIGMLFLIIGVLLVVVVYLVYRSHNFIAAFWVSVLTLVLALVHLYLVWRVNPVAGYAAIPLVVYLALVLYHLWFAAEEVTDCGPCLPVFE